MVEGAVPKKRKKKTGSKGPSFQEAVAALQGLHDDARRAGADRLSVEEIDALIREVRRGRKASGRGQKTRSA